MELNMSQQDYNRHYGGCIGVLNLPSKYSSPVLFSMDVIDGPLIVGSATNLHEKTEDSWEPCSFRYKEAGNATLDFRWPKLGLINFNKACVRVSQYPRRQWRRGFNLDSVQIKVIASYEQSLLGRRAVSRGDLTRARVAKEIFRPRYLTPGECYSTVASGERLAAAMSPSFFTQAVLGCDEVFLGYKSTLIGVLEQQPQSPIIAQLFHGNQFMQEQVQNYFHVGGTFNANS